jgi:hypothetical protein
MSPGSSAAALKRGEAGAASFLLSGDATMRSLALALAAGVARDALLRQQPAPSARGPLAVTFALRKES